MGTRLGLDTVVKGDDHISIADCCQTMGNDDCRATFTGLDVKRERKLKTIKTTLDWSDLGIQGSLNLGLQNATLARMVQKKVNNLNQWDVFTNGGTFLCELFSQHLLQRQSGHLMMPPSISSPSADQPQNPFTTASYQKSKLRFASTTRH